MRHIVLPACQSALSDSLCSCSRLVCTCLPHARLSRRPRLHDCELRARLLSRRVHLLLRGPTYRHVHRWMSRHRRLGCGRECHLPLLLLCCGRCCCCCCYYCIAAAAVAVAVAVLRGHCPLSLCGGCCRGLLPLLLGCCCCCCAAAAARRRRPMMCRVLCCVLCAECCVLCAVSRVACRSVAVSDCDTACVMPGAWLCAVCCVGGAPAAVWWCGVAYVISTC